MRCPTCGLDNPERMRFCGNCGSVLATAAGEERKLVTVLFADVVGSTAIAGRVDPERLRAQMARFFDIAREEIERYGGTVEKFIGDAVMAVFGLPAIHEDDPERAARAAAAIRARIQPAVEDGGLPPIRAGLCTGEVVANPRAVEKGEFLVTGEVVNLAARLQQHAEPGQILVSERTMLALRHTAALRALPPLSVKGRADPLVAWELGDLAPPREREVRATPFVGREEELDLLAGHLRRMRREGRGHVVTILGPAGVGKTRLAQEFRQRAGDAHSLRGRALPYGTGVPFWALGEAIREECGILFGDPLEEARRKADAVAARLEAADAVPALLSVLGLGVVGRDLTREELFAGMRLFFQALAERAPLLVILEDMHSAEDVTLDFLEHSADWIRETPLLLLVLSRPELLERRSTWMGGKRSASTFSLDPLGAQEGRALAQEILGGRVAPEAILDLVLQRAGGNPLFMEEILRSFIERAVLTAEDDRWVLGVPLAEVTIPDSVHTVIAARVDALPAEEKQVLQVSAVQGKDFWLGGVRHILTEDHVDEALAGLERKELVVRKPRSVLVAEEEFTFRHILIRDVAYGLLPKAQRWPMHFRLAEWTAQTAGDRQAEWAFYIAHHWLQVVSLRQELGLPPDVRAQEQAIAHLLLAADRAAGVYANATALDHYTRALDLDPPQATRLQVLLGRGAVWMLLGQFERAREDFAAARALARQTGDRRAEAMALDHLGHAYRQQDLIPEALGHLEPALALSREVGDPALTGRILNHIGFTYFSATRHAEAIRHHEEARRLLEQAGDLPGLAESLHGLGENIFFQGDFRTAMQRLLESARLSEEIGDRSLAGENRFMVAFAQSRLTDYEEARESVHRSLSTLVEIGDVRNHAVALWSAAVISTIFGDIGDALSHATQGLTLARQIGARRFPIYHLTQLGVIYRDIEDFHSALQVDKEAAALAQQFEAGWMPPLLAGLAMDEVHFGRPAEGQRYLGEAAERLARAEAKWDFSLLLTETEGRLLLAIGKPDEAGARARHLARLVEETGLAHWRLPALHLQADAAAAHGDRDRALQAYREAEALAERQRRLPILWRVQAGLAELHHVGGNDAKARAAAGRARATLERIAGSIADERLHAGFIQSPRVQRVITLAGT